jgi:phospholipase D1/2
MERMAEKSHWTKSNRFGSFSPIRLNVAAQWLVDGVNLFPLRSMEGSLSCFPSSGITFGTSAGPYLSRRRPFTFMIGGFPLVNIVNSLKNTVLWDVDNKSSEIQMRRPNKHHYRLDQLLKARAEAGVKIFVII